MTTQPRILTDGPCEHTGPHLILLNTTIAGDPTGRTVADVVKTAIDHAIDFDDTDIAAARLIIDQRADPGRTVPGLPPRGFVAVNTDELEFLRILLQDASEYMTENNYADDESMPDDAAAARYFGSGHRMECWTTVLAPKDAS